MSRTLASTDQPVDTIPGPVLPPPSVSRSRWGLWVWTMIGCILLGASGVVRAVQDRRHKDESSYLEACPFPLQKLPGVIGGWRSIKGADRILDPLTMRITGGTDHVMRTFVDELTGVSLMILVLFGPAEPVLPHTPQICYPASGFVAVEDPSDRLIKYDETKTALFRSGVYTKPGGRTQLREEVYHSFRLDGKWSPDIGLGRKFARRNPGVFKIQVQRRVVEGERRDRDDPIEQFLAVLLPEIERLIAESQSSADKKPSGPAVPAPVKTSMRSVRSWSTGRYASLALIASFSGEEAFLGHASRSRTRFSPDEAIQGAGEG